MTYDCASAHMPELKPCPFCGSKDVDVGYHLPMFGRNLLYYVICMECHATSVHTELEKKTIEAWNRRANEK